MSLVNVVDLKKNGLGSLGADQIAWLDDDLKGKSASTPIVLFAHIPLWMIAPEWGWGTEDSAQALALLSRFGSVTVLNGHIHQLMQKVEGNVTFHTARSTAFPQPAPGTAPSPGPKLVPAGELRKWLGVRGSRLRADADRTRRHRHRPRLRRTAMIRFSLVAAGGDVSPPAPRRPVPPATPTAANSSIRPARTAIRSTRTTSARVIAASSAARPVRCRTIPIPTRSNPPISSGTRRRSTSG